MEYRPLIVFRQQQVAAAAEYQQRMIFFLQGTHSLLRLLHGLVFNETPALCINAERVML